MATTTPNYGWDVPTSTDYVAQGAVAIETLGDDIDATLWTALGGNYPGLRLIKKQTIGSAVSSVTVTSAFSATYDVYKIIVAGGVSSGTSGFQLQLSGITTGYFSNMNYRTFANTGNQVANSGSQSAWIWQGGTSTSAQQMNSDIFNPFLTRPKSINSNFYKFDGGDVGISMGYNNSTTSATGFVLSASDGGATLTGGTIYVYGYGAS